MVSTCHVIFKLALVKAWSTFVGDLWGCSQQRLAGASMVAVHCGPHRTVASLLRV